MRTVFRLTNSSKATMLLLTLLAWSGAGYVYFTGDKVGFWLCLFGIPAATWAAVFTLTTRYIVDDTGFTVTGKLVPTRRFRWEEIVRVTCTRIKPFSLFPTSVRYKLEIRPPSPGKFAPYVHLSTDNIKNVDQLIHEIQTHLPPSVRNNTDWELKSKHPNLATGDFPLEGMTPNRLGVRVIAVLYVLTGLYFLSLRPVANVLGLSLPAGLPDLLLHVVYAFLYLILGIGLWRHRELARRVAIGYEVYNLIGNSLHFFLSLRLLQPGFEQRQLLEQKAAQASLAIPSEILPYATMFVLLACVVVNCVIIWMLIKQRAAFANSTKPFGKQDLTPDDIARRSNHPDIQ